MAAEFIYTANPSKVVPFLEKIRAAGKPDKVTLRTIESLGFRSTNDRALLPILKGLGFVDNSGVPTERWSRFRSKQDGGIALAEGIREHYAKLFNLYPDAYQKDNEALHSFFSSNTSLGEGALKFVIGTFKAVCSIATFDRQSTAFATPSLNAAAQPGLPAVIAHSQPVISSAPGLTVNINVQLTLLEKCDAVTFKEFCKAMREHLLNEK
jgi:hypothetical protein